MTRRLPFTSESKIFDFSGKGRYVVEPVGSSNHSLGAFVYLQREGEAEPLAGHIKVGICITDDHLFAWKCHGHTVTGKDFVTPEELASAVLSVSRYAERDPSFFAFNADSHADLELAGIAAAEQELERRRGILRRIANGTLENAKLTAAQASAELDLLDRRVADGKDAIETRRTRLEAVRSAFIQWAHSGGPADVRQLLTSALQGGTDPAPAAARR